MRIEDLLKDAYKEGMTIEEINEALASIELPTDNSAEVDRLKKALSNSNSEAAEYKRQLKEKMSADEIKAKEDAEAREKLQKDYDELKKKVAVSDNKAKLLALGYEDILAAIRCAYHFSTVKKENEKQEYKSLYTPTDVD